MSSPDAGERPGATAPEGDVSQAGAGTATAGGGTGAGRPQTVVVLAVAAVALAVGLVAGLLLGVPALRSAPADDSVDAGFSRDMQVHHGQAVEMSVLVRERSEDPEVRQLALDILLTQQQQQGQMFGWMNIWRLPQAAMEPMTWMGDEHDHGGDADHLMPGLATEEQMALLEAAEGAAADRLYLALMIPHHEGGVEMAEVAADRAQQPVVRRLAEGIITAQQSEITVLERMLAERGGAPEGL